MNFPLITPVIRLAMACGALLFGLALRPVEDFDTFWQLQTGKYLVQTGTFLYKDTFSLATEAFRLEHCWLHDLLLYGLYSLGGYHLLSLLLPLVIVLCAGLLWRRHSGGGGEAALTLPVLVLCLAASEPSWALRPQLWTFLFALLYLQLLHQGRDDGWRSWRWLVPIMLLWANLHAGCVFGLVLIGLFGVGELVRLARRQSSLAALGQLIGCGVLAFAAAFVNPNGWRIPLTQLLGQLNQYKVQTGTAGIGMLGNMEWLPPTFAQVPLFYVVFALWGGLLLCRWRRLDPAEAIFFVAFVYMGFGQIRHTTLVSLLAGFYLPTAVQEVFGPWLASARLRFAPVRWGTWGGVLLLALWLTWRATAGVLGWGLSRTMLPVAATEFIAAQKLPTNLYNAYDWGGYLMWRLYPDYLVFVDSRQDSMEHFEASNRIDNRWDWWREDLDNYRVNSVITRTCYYDTGGPLALIDGLAADPDWALVFGDEVAVVYVRRSAVTKVWLEQHARPAQDAFATMWTEASRLYAEDGARSRALLAMGRAAFRLGRHGEAYDAYAAFLRREPDNAEARAAVAILGKWLNR